MDGKQAGGRVEAVRHFNRDYTRRIGVLREGLLDSPFSLTQARVLYELAHREEPTATASGQELGWTGLPEPDPLRLRRRGPGGAPPSKTDGRQSHLRLTPRGRQAFGKLDAAVRDEVRGLLAPLSTADQDRLVSAMRTIERSSVPPKPALPARSAPPGPATWDGSSTATARSTTRSGDGAKGFEALVAEIVVKFMADRDPRRERAWIAELDGQRVGSIFLVAKSKTVAKLRLLLVEPSARGFGVGQRLVDECIRFARRAGYREIVLWTQSILDPARHIYAKAGFQLVGQEPNHEFGQGLTSETWS
jgi:GNAT superfamily N-acetyltransferase/DNA-binding MarR family transcriptional regulator